MSVKPQATPRGPFSERRISLDENGAPINTAPTAFPVSEHKTMTKTINEFTQGQLEPRELKMYDDASTVSIHYRANSHPSDVDIASDDKHDRLFVMYCTVGFERAMTKSKESNSAISSLIRKRITPDTHRVIITRLKDIDKGYSLAVHIYDLDTTPYVDYEQL